MYKKVEEAVPKVMSVALIESFDRWFLSLSKGSGTTRRNDCYTKCGGFDKLNHRNANLLDSPFLHVRFESLRHCSAFSLEVGTNPERICSIYTFALKACASSAFSLTLFLYVFGPVRRRRPASLRLPYT